MKVISIQNNKGGVGKTTTSDQMAVGLANAGYRTLLIDLDPQANSTDVFVDQKKFDFEKFLKEKLTIENYTLSQFAEDFDREVEFTYDLSDVLLDSSKMKAAIRSTRYTNLDLLPSSMKLSTTDTKIKLDDSNPQHNRLVKALGEVKDEYDYVIIDCPPILNILTVNALNACNEVVIPIKVDVGAIKGFIVTLNNIGTIIHNYRLNIKVKILFTMVNRNNVDKLLIDLFKKICHQQVYETTIRNQPKAVAQAGFEQTLVIENKKANVGIDYQALIDEIIEKEGK